jgi:electron transfer flavoprotein alpha subunit
MSVLVLVTHDRGRLEAASLQAITLARGLGGPVAALIAGEDGAALAAEAGRFGAASVSIATGEAFSEYAPGAWAAAVVALVERSAPAVVVAPGTQRGNEVLASVAARLDLPMAANVTEVRPGEPFTVTRQRWAGSLLEDARLEGSPKLLTVAPHAVPAEEASGAGAGVPTVDRFAPAVAQADLRVRVVGRTAPQAGSVSLGDARIVVGGGRGVGSAEGFRVLEELAALLGGVVGGSRVVTSNGWRSHADQIGQTGARIAPELYIACGISGAIQHIVGCRAAKRILAINTDPDAPIMERADYAVIGDLHAVVPAITAEIRRVTGG